MIALYRIKNEERWIERTLTRALESCSHAVIFDDHSTDSTPSILSKFDPERVIVRPSPFEGLNEPRDKEYLLNEACKLWPSWQWFLALDGDELLDKYASQKWTYILQDMDRQNKNMGWFQFLYLFDSEQYYRSDGVYSRAWYPRLFKIDTSQKQRFPQGNGPAGFHCGWIPESVLTNRHEIWRSEVKILHFGNFDRELRVKKYNWYRQNDPVNSTEDNYRHVLEENANQGVGWCPGPFQKAPVGDLL